MYSHSFLIKTIWKKLNEESVELHANIFTFFILSAAFLVRQQFLSDVCMCINEMLLFRQAHVTLYVSVSMCVSVCVVLDVSLFRRVGD